MNAEARDGLLSAHWESDGTHAVRPTVTIHLSEVAILLKLPTRTHS